MKVIIPVFKGCVTSSVIGMMDILNYSKIFHQQINPENDPANNFEVDLLSLDKSLEVDNYGFKISCSYLMENCPLPDVVIIPAAVGNMMDLLDQYPEFIEWIKMLSNKGILICSTCTGAFFIAKTGLLNGKNATTSWFIIEEFKKEFPEVNLLDEKIIVDNGNIITGGATLSFINLCIYLIERFYGKKIGTFCAKMLLVDKGKDSQLQYSIFHAQKIHKDEKILKAQEIIESKQTVKISIQDLAKEINMSERTFIRKFKSATGNTPLEYIQRVKVELAKSLIEEGKDNIKEISYQTGYEDISYFREVFKKYTGLSPIDYKRSFNFR